MSTTTSGVFHAFTLIVRALFSGNIVSITTSRLSPGRRQKKLSVKNVGLTGLPSHVSCS